MPETDSELKNHTRIESLEFQLNAAKERNDQLNRETIDLHKRVLEAEKANLYNIGITNKTLSKIASIEKFVNEIVKSRKFFMRSAYIIKRINVILIDHE
jgi:hypothetical protein